MSRKTIPDLAAELLDGETTIAAIQADDQQCDVADLNHEVVRLARARILACEALLETTLSGLEEAVEGGSITRCRENHEKKANV